MICTRNIRNKNVCVVSALFKRELQQSVEIDKKEATEVQFKVPWGIIAGKLWGDGSKQPILALHGWQDNAGSFDLLVPHLKNRTILAIDAPGHGLSSWLPKGIPYHDSMSIHIIRRIKRYFAWERVKLLAHSAGALASFSYASLYPDETEFVIAIDALQYKPLNFSRLMDRNKLIAKDIDKFLEYEEKNSPAPCHTEEVAIQRWIKGTEESLNEIAARTLLIRGATRKEDGTYFYNRDPNIRLNAANIGFTTEHLKQSAELIKCPYLVLRGAQSKIRENLFKDVVDIMQKNCQEFLLHTLPGTHHLHMVNAKGVAEIVNSFLDRYDM